MKVYDDVSQKTSDIVAQQKISEEIRDNGLGSAGGMLFGISMAQNIATNMEDKRTLSIDEQLESIKKLKDFLDAGILTEDEFKKKEKSWAYRT